ncbi:helix-turn-helix domain-containing protein [Streptomyces albospinus]
MGQSRRRLRTALLRAYDQGVPIRPLADTCGRSYGFVHTLLTEAGADLSPRGGPRGQGTGQYSERVDAAIHFLEWELGILCGTPIENPRL